MPRLRLPSNRWLMLLAATAATLLVLQALLLQRLAQARPSAQARLAAAVQVAEGVAQWQAAAPAGLMREAVAALSADPDLARTLIQSSRAHQRLPAGVQAQLDFEEQAWQAETLQAQAQYRAAWQALRLARQAGEAAPALAARYTTGLDSAATAFLARLNAWHAAEQARLAEVRAAAQGVDRAWRRGWVLGLIWAGLLALSLSALLLRGAPQQAWRRLRQPRRLAAGGAVAPVGQPPKALLIGRWAALVSVQFFLLADQLCRSTDQWADGLQWLGALLERLTLR
ncbi:hypothetical protein [Ideonella oryzae]|uniref:Uncharacterized protein n=1 Tax=Ideonella oryzae TaxID=2937441 RepID=A0ABT1BLE2_9BURK|nr:hypothetical protein [Ideonella oryzae]MCO5976933.1 hypothetical protein [Ideonella oryzae]